MRAALSHIHQGTSLCVRTCRLCSGTSSPSPSPRRWTGEPNNPNNPNNPNDANDPHIPNNPNRHQKRVNYTRSAHHPPPPP